MGSYYWCYSVYVEIDLSLKVKLSAYAAITLSLVGI